MRVRHERQATNCEKGRYHAKYNNKLCEMSLKYERMVLSVCNFIATRQDPVLKCPIEFTR